jgi:MFS family permease
MIQRLGHILRRTDLLAIFVMVFLADSAIGIARATFSLYATSLGATLAMVGTLGGIEGVTRILLSMPIGILSDRIDRRAVLSAGMAISGLSYLLFSFVHDPMLLYPVRVMMGAGIASTFFIGIAYVSDLVEKRDQGLVIGIYTTCMGLGFAIGSALGGQVAETLGYRAGYRIAGAIALVGFLLVWRATSNGQPRPRRPEVDSGRQEPFFAKAAVLIRRPGILTASLANLLITAVMEGGVFGFFPIYASSLKIGDGTIGSILSVRALTSTSSRLPSGALTARIPSRVLMVLALGIAMVAIFTISMAGEPIALAVILAVEGLAFGAFLASGHTFIAERTRESNRGSATGIYNTAGSIGTALGPIFMGTVAEVWGLRVAFRLMGLLLLVGIGIILVTSIRERQRAPESEAAGLS